MTPADRTALKAHLAPITPADLTAMRTHLGLSQQQLAERLGVSPHTVARWSMPSNNGRWQPDSDWSTRNDAADRVHYLNGGAQVPA